MRDDIKALQDKLAVLMNNLPEGVNVGIAIEDMRDRGSLYTYVTCDMETAGHLFDCAAAWCEDCGMTDFLRTHDRLHS